MGSFFPFHLLRASHFAFCGSKAATQLEWYKTNVDDGSKVVGGNQKLGTVEGHVLSLTSEMACHTYQPWEH